MCNFIIHNRKCLIPSKGSDYCHVHAKSIKLIKKCHEQAKEINFLNNKLQEARHKLLIIDHADRVKHELSAIAVNRSFRQAIDDPESKDDIERIFNAPQSKCIEIYNELLSKRNSIVHRYTSSKWEEPIKKKINNKSVYSKYFHSWITSNKNYKGNFQRTLTNKSLSELAKSEC